MKKLIALMLMSVLLLSGCGYTEDDLAAEWEEGYAQGKEDGYELGKIDGYKEGHSDGLEEAYNEATYDYEAEEEYCEEYSSTESSGSEEITVYVTDTGTKYHRSGCGSLWNSSHERSLSQAISQGYGPCGNCNPPTQ